MTECQVRDGDSPFVLLSVIVREVQGHASEGHVLMEEPELGNASLT